MRELWELFITFCRIGGFTFGGGYAMLPIIQSEIVEKRNWATDEEVMDYYAIGQCTPGIIAVNTATFIGYRYKGIPGAIMATLGIVFPSLIIITTISAYFTRFRDYEIIAHAFGGIRVAVTALILSAVTNMWKKSVTDLSGIAIFVVSFITVAFTEISPIIIIVISAIIGIIIRTSRYKRD